MTEALREDSSIIAWSIGKQFFLATRFECCTETNYYGLDYQIQSQ